jgi:hypothetical protein
MTLYDKIVQIYPQLKESDFNLVSGTIMLRNDNDGRGDYIAKWNHPTLQRPTDEQLAEIN